MDRVAHPRRIRITPPTRIKSPAGAEPSGERQTRHRMHRDKRWNILPQHDLTADLASRLKTSPLIAQILLTRGYATPDDCAAFLRPSLKHLHDPATLPGVTRAA